MEVKFELAVSILFLFFLTLGSANASVFYINSTQANVNDTIWNSTDEYSIYLDYTNPYADLCSDLRECYIDDTNSGTMVDTQFLIETFFENDTNLQPATFGYGTYSQKLTNSTKKLYYRDNQTYYYLIAIFNDTSQANSYKAIVQRGTVVDIYNNLTFRDEYTASRASSGCSTKEDDWNIYAVCYLGGATLTYSFFYLSNGQTDFFITMRSISGSAVFDVVSHLKSNELGVSSFGSYDLAVFGSNMTDFSGAVHLDNVSVYNGTELLIKTSEKYFTLNPDGSWYGYPLHGYDEIRMKPTVSRVATLAGNYRSVALPTCDDIAEGNTQTLMYYQNGYWIRSCEGVVPTPEMEQFTCTIQCSQTGLNYTYIQQNKTIMYNPISPSAVSYVTHTSIFDKGDGFGNIFDVGTDISNITDLKVYTNIEFESYNDTQKFGVYGVSGLSPVSGSNSYVVCDSLTGECNIPLYTRMTPVVSLDNGDVKCYTGSLNFTEYTINNLMTKNYYTIYEPMVVGLFTSYYPISESWYINTWWKFSDVPFSTDCDTINPNYFPYTTIINSSTKYIRSVATWKNITGSYPVCIQYEPICTPVVPPDYTYNPEDIICVGQHCYVYAQPTCDNDGTCDAPVETYLTCPSDCKTPTGGDVLDIGMSTLANFLFGFLDSVGENFGIGTDGAKFGIWSMVVVVAMVVAVSSSGNMIVGAVTGLMFLLLGVIVGWIPLWVGVILITLTALLVAKTFSDMIRGG